MTTTLKDVAREAQVSLASVSRALNGTGVLTVGSPALSSVATGAGNAVTVRFRVTIN